MKFESKPINLWIRRYSVICLQREYFSLTFVEILQNEDLGMFLKKYNNFSFLDIKI